MRVLDMLRGKVSLLMTCIMVFGVAVSFGMHVDAQSTQDFKIISFVADYYLERNEAKTSSVRVVENIVAEFPSHDQNHGILRAIPQSYQGHTVNLKVEAVINEAGKPHNFTTYGEADNLVIKIGDADKYVHGRQTYRITYTMRNVISILEDHEEFYWDINGDQWQQPFGSVMARVHIPADLSPHLQAQQRCIAGIFGSNTEDYCSIGYDATGESQIVTANATNLSPGETLTVVLGFNKGTFQLGPEIAAEKSRKQMLIIAAASGVVLPPILTVFWIYRRWHKYGKDPAGKGVIIPEYQPPKNLSVLASDFIMHEGLRDKAISALMIELAVQGYVKIYDIPKKGLFGKKDYELEFAKDSSGLSPADEAYKVLKMFFTDGLVVGSRVKLSGLKNELYQERQTLNTHMGKVLFEKKFFRTDPNHARRHYQTIGWVLAIAGFVMITALGRYLWPLGLGTILSGLMVILTARTMPARSRMGVEIRDYLHGLRDYMKLAEEDRIRFLQSPEGAEKIAAQGDPTDPKQKVKLFEKLLPYAILFGMEKEWAKQFKDLYTTPPDWYHGNWSTFNTMHLASSLGGFNNVNAASFAAPSSSGSSGFGGGGFSGGGGGGGGGGGW